MQNEKREHRRLRKELQEIQKGNVDDRNIVTAEIIGNDITRWKGNISGPVGTPYEGGIFVLNIVIPDEYPFTAPKIKFETPVWHPNISSKTGAICLDILKSEWSPAMTIRTALVSIQALLSAPEPDSPQDNEVATMYKQNQERFISTAKQWTETYAVSKSVSEARMVRTLIDMGFDEQKARVALERSGWNQEVALNELLE